MTDATFDYSDYALEDQQMLESNRALFRLVHSAGIPITISKRGATLGIRINDGWLAIDPDDCTLVYLKFTQVNLSRKERA